MADIHCIFEFIVVAIKKKFKAQQNAIAGRKNIYGEN